MLPFKTQPRTPDTIEVGDHITGVLEMPRMGSLTVAEDLAYVDALANAAADLTGQQLMAHVRPALALIALQRIQPDLSPEDMQQPPLNTARLQEKLSSYLIAEKNGDVPPEVGEPEGEDSPKTGATTGKRRTKTTAKSTPDSADDGQNDTTGTASAAA